MKDQIIISKNAELAIAVPLFRMHHEEALAKADGYHVFLTSIPSRPIAYAIDLGSGNLMLVNAEMLEQQVEFLGEL